MWKRIINSLGVIMQDNKKKYILFSLLMAIIVAINFFIFAGKPSTEVEQIEEKIVQDVTGIDVNLTPTQ
jgi:hypothetical protein